MVGEFRILELGKPRSGCADFLSAELKSRRSSCGLSRVRREKKPGAEVTAGSPGECHSWMTLMPWIQVVEGIEVKGNIVHSSLDVMKEYLLSTQNKWIVESRWRLTCVGVVSAETNANSPHGRWATLLCYIGLVNRNASTAWSDASEN